MRLRSGAFPWAFPGGVSDGTRDLAGVVPDAADGGIYAHERILRRATVPQLSRRRNKLSGGTRTLVGVSGGAGPKAGSASDRLFAGRDSLWSMGFTGTYSYLVVRGTLLRQSRASDRGENTKIQKVRVGVARCGDAAAGICDGCRAREVRRLSASGKSPHSSAI